MRTSVDELADIVSAAQKATESLSDSDLQKVAFERVLDHLLRNGEESASELVSPADSAAEGSTVGADSVLADDQQRADAIASYFKVDPGDVGHVFEVSGEEPRLVVHASRLEARKALATRQIALLVVGARTALGQETTTSHIRTAVDDHNRLDGSNFMKTLADMPEISVLGKHGSPNRVVRMRVFGTDKAQLLAQQLIGG